MPELFPLRANLPSYLTYDLVMSKFKRFKPLQSGFSLNLLNSSLFAFDSAAENDPQQVADHIDRIFTEAAFLCPDMLMVQSFTRKVDTKIYYYRFMPKASARKAMPWAKGATHSEEIQFVLGHPLISADYTADEVALSKEIMRYWTNFARYGDPTPVYDVLGDDFWSPCTGENRYYMRLDLNGSQLVKGMPENQCGSFFEDLYSYIRLKYSYYRY